MAAGGRNSVLTPANVVAVLLLAAVLIGSTVLVARSFVAPTAASAETGAGLQAVVHDADGLEHRLPLGENTTLTVVTSAGANVVEVRDGAVLMAEADCEGQDCVHQGELTAPGRQIICLPHQLWVEVLAESDAEAPSSNVDVFSR